jgi:hypothetical protein
MEIIDHDDQPEQILTSHTQLHPKPITHPKLVKLVSYQFVYSSYDPIDTQVDNSHIFYKPLGDP